MEHQQQSRQHADQPGGQIEAVERLRKAEVEILGKLAQPQKGADSAQNPAHGGGGQRGLCDENHAQRGQQRRGGENENLEVFQAFHGEKSPLRSLRGGSAFSMPRAPGEGCMERPVRFADALMIHGFGQNFKRGSAVFSVNFAHMPKEWAERGNCPMRAGEKCLIMYTGSKGMLRWREKNVLSLLF